MEFSLVEIKMAPLIIILEKLSSIHAQLITVNVATRMANIFMLLRAEPNISFVAVIAPVGLFETEGVVSMICTCVIIDGVVGACLIGTCVINMLSSSIVSFEISVKLSVKLFKVVVIVSGEVDIFLVICLKFVCVFTCAFRCDESACICARTCCLKEGGIIWATENMHKKNSQKIRERQLVRLPCSPVWT